MEQAPRDYALEKHPDTDAMEKANARTIAQIRFAHIVLVILIIMFGLVCGVLGAFIWSALT